MIHDETVGNKDPKIPAIAGMMSGTNLLDSCFLEAISDLLTPIAAMLQELKDRYSIPRIGSEAKDPSG